ncbi:polysaccharide biosynthesis tyrosine autokinase [Ilyomonas limi]|uniref:non-specific protein-tyrosine kinase n=1 Tax=Ilyomonas limi TaxID=2575867 RepID=A0A4U3L369_9BACT|nr:tyrosine-protein kinase [Ilyomonas limi]TKK67987.1 polysaccharide biosynthesis tyrosine autokinase [Ilyomonas limi]
MEYNLNGNGAASNGSISHTDDADIFDIKKVIGNIIANWYYFVLGLVLMLVLAFLYVRYTEPVYQVNAGIMVEDQSGGSSGSSSLSASSGIFQDLGGAFSMASTVNNEEEILLTRSLMYRVVKDLQLNVSYYKKEDIRTIETFEKTPYSVHLVAMRDSIAPFTLHWKEVNPTSYALFDSKDKQVVTGTYGDTVHYNKFVFYINRNKYIKIDKDNEDKFFFQITSYDNATAAYQKNLVITVPDDKANVIDLSMTSKVPSKGEFILNYFIQRYLRSSLEQRNQIADSTLSFINERLGIVTGELGNVEKQIALYKGNNKIISPDVQAQLMASTYDENFKLGNQLELQLAIIKNLKEYLQDERNNKRIVPSNLVTSDPTFTELVGKYNTLMIERDRVSLNYPDTNPLLQNIDMQLSNLRRDMINNLSSSQASITETKSHLQTNDRSLNSQIFTAPNVEKGYLELAREQKIKEALYLFLVQRREEVAISRSSNMAKATVIDEPKALAEPVSPNKAIVYIAALILGLFIPAMIIYIRSILNTRILSREDVTKKTKVSVLAELGHRTSPDMIVTHNTSRALLAEQFRTLRTNLQFVLRGKDQNVIMITSSMGGEGKSFTSLNLANVLSLADNRVLLIDFDLRKPKVFKYLDLPEGAGITNYLISDIDVEKIIIPSGVQENFFVVGAGTVPPNPTELLMNPKMNDFFAFVKKHFDYVIIDSAPVGLVSDAQILSKFADVCLYVVRQRFTLKNQLYIVQDMYENKKINNLYIILNDVKSQSRYGYGGGYSYGYGYGYGNSNGYFETEGKSKRKKLSGMLGK